MHIKYRDYLYGYYYVYRGYVNDFSYALQPATGEKDYRDNLIMKTTPIIPYRITALYDDGTTYTFNYRSTNTSLWGW